MTHRPTPRVEMLEPRRLLAALGPDPTFASPIGTASADFVGAPLPFLDLPGVPKTEYDVQVTTGRVAADARGRLLVPTTTAGEQVHRPYKGRDFLYRLDSYGELDPTFAAGGV